MLYKDHNITIVGDPKEVGSHAKISCPCDLHMTYDGNGLNFVCSHGRARLWVGKSLNGDWDFQNTALAWKDRMSLWEKIEENLPSMIAGALAGSLIGRFFLA